MFPTNELKGMNLFFGSIRSINFGAPRTGLSRLLLLVMVLQLSGFEATAVAQETQELVWGKVIQIYDGDTIAIKSDQNKVIRVQLAYVDAPDRDSTTGKTQPLHDESLKTLKDMIIGKEVIIESMGTDKFKRIVGIIFLDKLNINAEMVRKGMAEIYHPVRMNPSRYKENYVNQLKTAESQAKSAKVGIWGHPGYVSPYKFRRGNR